MRNHPPAGARIAARLGLTTLACLVSAAVTVCPLLAQQESVTPCGDPDGHEWIAVTRDQVMERNELVAFAVETAGDPASCEGSVTVWQGEEYGHLRIGFDGGVEFSLETMPPGILIMELGAEGGFADADAAVEALRRLTERMGVSIDWTMPEESEQDGIQVRQYWDPEPGLNASATVGRSGGRVISLRWSIAP